MPKHPTKANQEIVKALIPFLSQVDVAKRLGISEPTLTKYYRKEIDESKAEAVRQVGEALFYNAVVEKDTNAQKFFLKNRGGEAWREKVAIDVDEEGKRLEIAQNDAKLIKDYLEGGIIDGKAREITERKQIENKTTD